MATQSRDTFMYRPECIKHTLVLGVGDATGTYKLSMAPGVYELSVSIVKTADFSNNVKIGLLKPFLSSAQVAVADAAFLLAYVTDTTGATEITIASGAGAVAKNYAVVGSFGQAIANADHGPFSIPYGLQITWTNASSITTGSVVVEILAARMV